MPTGRARGKHDSPPRMGEGSDQISGDQVSPDSPLGREYGMSTRVQGAPSPIPGGKTHIVSPQTFQQKPAAPNPSDFTDLPVDNVHGVPPTSHNGYTRAQLTQGKLANRKPADQYYEAPRKPVIPIPVRIVETQNDIVFRSAAPYNLVLNPQGTPSGETRICGRDPKRHHVMILNESSAHNFRIAQRPTDLNNHGGALIPWPSNSYVKIYTQDELYAISDDTGSPQVSIIQVFDQPGTGL
jgi:hypothetical protein